ncbi:SDR family oxidoreductase [Salibacter halophilus]|uniref:SDR family oxidoreductase n=1 Tax=Salibacter halophilus TaxID=1803916 RepID=A0A6N6M7U9_9FLAO|nr:SDR family oxidoreductase [Salibacter halophilus]KAB1064003.1 SDR family oxidoreductase [Salibacter halophilus]
MDLDLTGRTALVAGSTQGIGKCAAMEMAEMGANIVLIARNEEKLKRVVSELPTDRDNTHEYIVADFTKPMEVKKAVNDFIGQSREINILVNNTGGPPGGPIIDADIDEFQNAFDAHLKCNHILVQACYPSMKRSGYGRIINVISTSVKAPLANLGVSNTIRGAVANWSKTLATELGPDGITVNNVLPGATNTSRLDGIAKRKSEKTGKPIEEVLDEMGNAVPLKRVAEPEETANAIAFLASPAAAYISGINIPVDGGRTPTL